MELKTKKLLYWYENKNGEINDKLSDPTSEEASGIGFDANRKTIWAQGQEFLNNLNLKYNTDINTEIKNIPVSGVPTDIIEYDNDEETLYINPINIYN